jgi:hypothetical protein
LGAGAPHEAPAHHSGYFVPAATEEESMSEDNTHRNHFKLYTLDRIESQYAEIMTLMWAQFDKFYEITWLNLICQNAIRLMAMDALGIDEDRNKGGIGT